MGRGSQRRPAERRRVVPECGCQRQCAGGGAGTAPGRAGQTAFPAAHAAARREFPQRQHLSFAVVWARPLACRAGEHDLGALLCRAGRTPAPAFARIREIRLAGGRSGRQVGVPGGQGRAAQGQRCRPGIGHGGLDAVRLAVARRPPERDRSAARRPAGRTRSGGLGPGHRIEQPRLCQLRRRSRWRPASASCWRARRPVSRRATARSTTTSS